MADSLDPMANPCPSCNAPAGEPCDCSGDEYITARERTLESDRSRLQRECEELKTEIAKANAVSQKAHNKLSAARISHSHLVDGSFLTRIDWLVWERDQLAAKLAAAESERIGKTLAPTEWIDKLTAQAEGRCLETIGFIACGEGGNYCSKVCELKAKLAEAERENERLQSRVDLLDNDRARICGQVTDLKAECEAMRTPRPLDAWHEDDGSALWWMLPVCEPPYCGTPLDDDWPYDDDEHPVWTVLPLPIDAALAARSKP